jgi:hypothetical protein
MYETNNNYLAKKKIIRIQINQFLKIVIVKLAGGSAPRYVVGCKVKIDRKKLTVGI